MRLSEAIRLGAMLKPQGFGVLRDASGATCALGAALDAIGHGENYTAAYIEFPICRASLIHPVRGGASIGMYVLMTLNDDHRWTREQIADWVQTIEERETERTEQATSEHAVAVSVAVRTS